MCIYNIPALHIFTYNKGFFPHEKYLLKIVLNYISLFFKNKTI